MKTKNEIPREARFLNACALTQQEAIDLSRGSMKDRLQATTSVSELLAKENRTLNDPLPLVTTIQPMTFWENAACVAFLGCAVPNGVFIVPGVTYFVGKILLRGNVSLAFKGLAIILMPLVVLPQKFVPSTLHSWLANITLKYFSFRFISEQYPKTMPKTKNTENEIEKHAPQILVAPPHGVFPYGNLLAMLVWPSLTGHHFQGLAANAALRIPIFKQVLRSMGVIDASRQSARKALENFPYTIGISTGGVAEVFETGADDECILLKERIGLIKLAIRTGADLVPCYLYGNNKLFSCWKGQGIPGGRTFLEKVSRKIGFALILYRGRWGLPIPYRIPILAVKGRPIPTAHLQCEEPTNEQISQVQNQLLQEMEALFDRYKGLYGWQDKTLIIK